MPERSDSSRRPLLLLVTTVHLDSQWRWTILDTIREFIPRTLRENFALFESHPNYRVNFEGAFRYMLAREYYPDEFEELKRWVAAGRWIPAGAMLDAPDVNCVSPESLLRHILYGNRFFEHELGRASRDLFLPDCFGFGQALPTVATHCGLTSFSTSKPIKWCGPAGLPFDFARWRGPDGSEILAAIATLAYGERIEEDLSRSPFWIERLGRPDGLPVGLRYMGTGDQGGSPDRDSVDWIERLADSDGPIDVRNIAADALADEMPAELRDALPLYDDELLLPTHGTGCWTAQAALKRWNRRNESLADAAERAATVADWLGAVRYPRERLGEGWLRFLWHQMHDDLTGTSVPEAYRFTWNDEAVASNLFAGVLTDSIAAVAEQLDTSTDGLPLVVYNPCGHPRHDVVEVELEGDDLPEGPLSVIDARGRAVPCQEEPSGDGRRRLLFPADVGPVSWTVFSVVAAAGAAAAGDELDVSTGHLENSRYRVEIDADGDVSRLFDKQLGRELLAGPIQLELLRNRSMRWPAWEIRPETILENRVAPRIGGPARIRVLESGPVRIAVEITRRSHGSRFVERVRLAAGGAGHRLEIDSTVDWRTRGRLLKASFPLAVANAEAVYDLGVGTIRRGNNRPERYEVPAQQWAGVDSPDDAFGVAVLNDCKYGWDKPDDDTLRLSLVHSPTSLRKYPHQRTQDHGRHRFTIGLLGHRGSGDRATVHRQAESLNRPLEAFAVAASAGPLGRSLSFLECEGADLALRALKRAEDDDGVVVRLQEIGGRGTGDAALNLAAPVLEAHETDGCEKQIGMAAVDRGSLRLAMPAAGLGTWSLSIARPGDVQTPDEGTPLELPWNDRAASFHDRAERVDFDGHGRSLPGELLPASLPCGPVRFRLAAMPRTAPHVLRSAGQEIELPEGSRTLWLLAASTAGPLEVDLAIDDAPHALRVASWTGWLAERSRPARRFGLGAARPGRLVRDEIGWLGTHRHRIGRDGGVEDDAYRFCYLFRYAIPLPAGARKLRLPDTSALCLFAATTRGDGAPRPRPGRPLYEPGDT